MVIVIYPFGCYHNLGFVFFIHPSIGAFLQHYWLPGITPDRDDSYKYPPEPPNKVNMPAVVCKTT